MRPMLHSIGPKSAGRRPVLHRPGRKRIRRAARGVARLAPAPARPRPNARRRRRPAACAKRAAARASRPRGGPLCAAERPWRAGAPSTSASPPSVLPQTGNAHREGSGLYRGVRDAERAKQRTPAPAPLQCRAVQRSGTIVLGCASHPGPRARRRTPHGPADRRKGPCARGSSLGHTFPPRATRVCCRRWESRGARTPGARGIPTRRNPQRARTSRARLRRGRTRPPTRNRAELTRRRARGLSKLNALNPSNVVASESRACVAAIPRHLWASHPSRRASGMCSPDVALNHEPPQDKLRLVARKSRDCNPSTDGASAQIASHLDADPGPRIMRTLDGVAPMADLGCVVGVTLCWMPAWGGSFVAGRTLDRREFGRRSAVPAPMLATKPTLEVRARSVTSRRDLQHPLRGQNRRGKKQPPNQSPGRRCSGGLPAGRGPPLA